MHRYLPRLTFAALSALILAWISLVYDQNYLHHRLVFFQGAAPPFPYIKSTHSLVAKHVTPEKWDKLGGIKTKTSGFTLSKVGCKYIF